MIPVSIEVPDLNPVLSGFSELARGFTRMSPMFERCGDEFYRQEVNWFASHPFASLSPAYAIKKRETFGDKPILRATDAMYNSFTQKGAEGNIHRVDDQEAEFGSADPKAAFMSGTSRMPARPPLAQPDESRYVTIADDYVGDLIRGAGLN